MLGSFIFTLLSRFGWRKQISWFLDPNLIRGNQQLCFLRPKHVWFVHYHVDSTTNYFPRAVLSGIIQRDGFIYYRCYTPAIAVTAESSNWPTSRRACAALSHTCLAGPQLARWFSNRLFAVVHDCTSWKSCNFTDFRVSCPVFPNEELMNLNDRASTSGASQLREAAGWHLALSRCVANGHCVSSRRVLR